MLCTRKSVLILIALILSIFASEVHGATTVNSTTAAKALSEMKMAVEQATGTTNVAAAKQGVAAMRKYVDENEFIPYEGRPFAPIQRMMHQDEEAGGDSAAEGSGTTTKKPSDKKGSAPHVVFQPITYLIAFSFVGLMNFCKF